MTTHHFTERTAVTRIAAGWYGDGEFVVSFERTQGFVTSATVTGPQGRFFRVSNFDAGTKPNVQLAQRIVNRARTES